MKKKKEEKKKKKLKQKQKQKEAEKGKEAEKEKDNKNSKSEQNTNNVSVLQKISKAKLKAENLDRKVEREEKLLKYNGGIENDPEGGQKLTGYIMSSIKTKLNILNELYKSH